MLVRSSLKRTYANLRLHSTFGQPKSNRWRWIPISLGTIAGGAFYYFSYYRPQQLKYNELSPDHFTSYRISYKNNIDECHFLMELTPLVEQKVNLWSKMGCEKLWSVELKQPDVMVVRNYTPLPLQLNLETNQLDVFEDGNFAGGKLFFYIKQYEQGEVARWLHNLPEGHIVELRGPFTDYQFPHYEGEKKRDRGFLTHSTNANEQAIEGNFLYQPFDIAMFTAGTGIVTALQLLLTENPFRGTIDLFFLCNNYSELGPLGSTLRILEKNGRLCLHLIESCDEPVPEKRLNQLRELIPQPSVYPGILPFKSSTQDRLKPVLSLVCGPEGFIAAIAGRKYDPAQGPIGGLLKEKNWDGSNVYKLS